MGCCGKPDDVRNAVREGYGRIAEEEVSPRRQAASCCGSSDEGTATDLARIIGYDVNDLAQLPEGANMGLSCGNPVALGQLREGEVIVDLGSGGGFDIFIASKKVGPGGRAIGVDMTPAMLNKARKNAIAYRERTGFDNVEFRLGEIEHLPLADNSADVVISNCVINLSPDKQQVWREIARVLKPGGRVAVSDLALLKPLPPAVGEMVEALIGCVSGAELVGVTETMIRDAGLTDIVLEKKSEYIASMSEWKDPLYEKIVALLPEGDTVADYVTSLGVSAKKPKGCCCG